eukprot:COSAG01_NODE_6483_length_3639_cov_27.490113_3_plen_378_part_00
MEGFQARASSATTRQIQAGRQVKPPLNPANATSTASALTATKTAEAVRQKRVAALSNSDQTSTVPLAKSGAERDYYEITDEGLNEFAAKCTQLSSLNLDWGFESASSLTASVKLKAFHSIGKHALALELEEAELVKKQSATLDSAVASKLASIASEAVIEDLLIEALNLTATVKPELEPEPEPDNPAMTPLEMVPALNAACILRSSLRFKGPISAMLRDPELDERYRIAIIHCVQDESLSFIDANLEGANLSYANLSKEKLSHSIIQGFSGANFSGANLVNANLIGANLEGACLLRANLIGANLKGANFMTADLRKANLTGANLTWANLMHADLRGADLRGADLSWVNLLMTKLDQKAFSTISEDQRPHLRYFDLMD